MCKTHFYDHVIKPSYTEKFIMEMFPEAQLLHIYNKCPNIHVRISEKYNWYALLNRKTFESLILQ